MFENRSLRAAICSVPVIALYALAPSAVAEEFSWQIAGGYGETERAPFADTERTTLDATYFFDPVDDARGPYALAPFLNRSSRVTAGITNERTTITVPVASIGAPPPGPTTATLTEETRGYAVSGHYVWSRSGWYVGASYRDSDTDHDANTPSSQQGTTTDGYQLLGGRYFGESTSLDLSASATHETTQLTITCLTSLCLSGGTSTRVDADDWSIGGLHVRRGTRLTYAISGRISGTDVELSVDPLVLTLPPGTALPSGTPAQLPGSGVYGAFAFNFVAAPLTSLFSSLGERETYSVAGEIFPTDRLGVRIGLSRADADYTEDDSYDLAATWFFKRAVAVQFVVARTTQERFDRDVDSAELRLLGRL